MVTFELFLTFVILTTALAISIAVFYKVQAYQPTFHRLKLVITVLILLSVSFYILNSLPNLYNKTDVILTSETVIPSNLVFIFLCILVYFFLKRLSFSEYEAIDNTIEEDDEFKDQEDFNEDFVPKYEDLEFNHKPDKSMTTFNWEEDKLTTINEMKFKELNEYIKDLYEKQLKS